MTFIFKFVEYNHIISCGIAIICNSLLMYLALTSSKSKMFKQMSYSLLQNCVLDLLLSVIVLIDQPVGFVLWGKSQLETGTVNRFQFNIITNGIYYSVMGGPLNYLGFGFSKSIIMLFGTTMTLSVQAMSVPFYFRYLVLCKYERFRSPKRIAFKSLNLETPQ